MVESPACLRWVSGASRWTLLVAGDSGFWLGTVLCVYSKRHLLRLFLFELQSVSFREARPQAEVCVPWHKPPRSLAGTFPGTFAQLIPKTRYPAIWGAVSPRPFRAVT